MFRQLTLYSLMLLVFVSALAVVHNKHQSRKLFMQLQALQMEKNQMNNDWSRYRLERGTLTTNGKIEQLARNRLQMEFPRQYKAIIVDGN